MKGSDILRWGLISAEKTGASISPQINMAYLSAENVEIDAILRCCDKKGIPRRKICGG